MLRVIGRCSEATAKECFGDQQFATTLVATLDDPNPAVRAALCFAVCNLCATASCPARQLLLDKARPLRRAATIRASLCMVVGGMAFYPFLLWMTTLSLVGRAFAHSRRAAWTH